MSHRLVLTALVGLLIASVPAVAQVDDEEWKTTRKEYKALWDEGKKVSAVNMLGGCDDVRAVRELWRVLTSKESTMLLRQEIVPVLRWMTHDKAIDLIILNLTAKLPAKERAERCTAAAGLDNEAVDKVLIGRLRGKVPATRAVAAEVLGLILRRSAIPELANALADKDKLVRKAVATALERLTGLVDATPDTYKKWWVRFAAKLDIRDDTPGKPVQRRGSVVGGKTPDPKEPEDDPGKSVPPFYGKKINKTKLIFVLDKSSTMKTRMTDLRDELAGILKGMSKSKRYEFTIIFFDGLSHVFTPKLVPATSKWVRKANAFIKKQEGKGATNPVPALERAQRIARADGIVFLTDGVLSNDSFSYLIRYLRAVTDPRRKDRRIKLFFINLFEDGDPGKTNPKQQERLKLIESLCEKQDF